MAPCVAHHAGDPLSALAAGSGAAHRVSRAGTAHATRVPAGHPQGYVEAFAQRYLDAAPRIEALDAGLPPPSESRLLTTVEDGVAGLRFVRAVLDRGGADGAWRLR